MRAATGGMEEGVGLDEGWRRVLLQSCADAAIGAVEVRFAVSQDWRPKISQCWLLHHLLRVDRHEGFSLALEKRSVRHDRRVLKTGDNRSVTLQNSKALQ